MTSLRQFEANRRNALRSTGPKTGEGKRRSRLNAVRHGLTAETVVAHLEDAEDYKAFEAAIIADIARKLLSRESSCFGSHRYYGAFVAPRPSKQTFLRFRQRHWPRGDQVTRFVQTEGQRTAVPDL